ncbi:MAG: hypothetical protein HUK25_00360 [Treponema sp.]|nr:hypothetical protein [Treponema sp.]
MIRVEIIANQSVEDDIKENLHGYLPDLEYTILPAVQGKGKTSSKLGDATWPEMNFLLFSYVDEETAKKVKTVIDAVINKFPNEGISLFACPAVDL